MNDQSSSPADLAVRFPSTMRYEERSGIFPNARGQALPFDLYLPAETRDPMATVILVTGYPEAGVQRIFGRSSRHFRPRSSWCELFANEGIAALAYEAHEPAQELEALLKFLGTNGVSIGIDPTRLALFATSGHVPTALSTLAHNPTLRCAALLYGFMLDSDGDDRVARAASDFHFANPSIELSMSNIPKLPLLIVRAGRDTFAGLNDAIDRFVRSGLAENRPLTVINHADGAHAFDLLDDGRDSRYAIRSVIEFMRSHLD